MPHFRIRDCRVVRLRPRRAAAPSGPPTIPLASFNAFKMPARSAASVPPEFRRLRGAAGLDPPIISGMSTRSSGPLLKMTDRSMTF